MLHIVLSVVTYVASLAAVLWVLSKQKVYLDSRPGIYNKSLAALLVEGFVALIALVFPACAGLGSLLIMAMYHTIWALPFVLLVPAIFAAISSVTMVGVLLVVTILLDCCACNKR